MMTATPGTSAPPSQFIERAGFRIHYTVHGEGRPVILLHGAGLGSTGLNNFQRNIEALSRHHRIYVIDIPGWGKSSKPLGEGDHFTLVGRAVLAFMDGVGIDKAHLVGITLGASGALHMAMAHPERVDRLVLLAPAGGIAPGQSGPTPGIIQLLSYYANEGPTREKLRVYSKQLTYDPAAITAEVLEERFLASIDPEIVANPTLKLPSGPPSGAPLCKDPRLEQLSHRVLIIWGLEDRINLPSGAFSFQTIPKADFIFFAKSGHWTQWERPVDFNDSVNAFLLKE